MHFLKIEGQHILGSLHGNCNTLQVNCKYWLGLLLWNYSCNKDVIIYIFGIDKHFVH